MTVVGDESVFGAGWGMRGVGLVRDEGRGAEMVSGRVEVWDWWFW